MVEIQGYTKNTADVVIVGGGSVGLHTAHALYEQMGRNARIVAITQEGEWGGIAGRSLEQYRMFNDSYALAEIVGKGIELYQRVDEELKEKHSTERAFEKFPYIFTVGDKQRPDYIKDILPPETPERPEIGYYARLKNDTENWGFDPEAEVVNADELRQHFPLLDGDGIVGAMIVNNAGRLHFDVMKGWMMDQSRADGNGRGVSYLARTAVRKVLLGNNGKAIGIDTGKDKLYSDNVILTLGSFAVNLPNLLACDESQRIANNFTITQRELFFANMPGVQENTNFFLISPDMAIARISTTEGHASYGFAAADDLVTHSPSVDPRPNEEFLADLQMQRNHLFVGRTYAMLSECSSRWNSDYYEVDKPNLAVEPFGYSAGYYSAYRDGLPVVGEIAETGVILAAGSHHSGIMGGRGIALLAVDHIMGTNNLSLITHQQTSIGRTPSEHTGLML